MTKPAQLPAVPAEKSETTAAQAYELLGMAKAFEFQRRWLTVSTLNLLKSIKSTKAYLKIADCQESKPPTWATFCERLGLSSKTVDEWLRNLDAFGADFMASAETIGLSVREFRGLRRLPEGMRPEAKDGILLVPGHDPIPIDPNHSAEIHEAIQDIMEDASRPHRDALKESEEDRKSIKRELKAAVRRSDEYHAALKLHGLDPDGEATTNLDVVIERCAGQVQQGVGGLSHAVKDLAESDPGPKQKAAVAAVLELVEETCANVRRDLDMG